jgi:hypothetical protein
MILHRDARKTLNSPRRVNRTGRRRCNRVSVLGDAETARYLPLRAVSAMRLRFPARLVGTSHRNEGQIP